MPGPFAKLITPRRGLIFRITHRDNVRQILQYGVHCRTSPIQDPNFVQIGNPEIIDRRQHVQVRCGPHGGLSDYVPFYFTPCTPMLHNIVTGYNGMKMTPRTEIAILVSSLTNLESAGVPFVIADRNATLQQAAHAPGRELVPKLAWNDWQNCDYRKDPERLEKFERYQAEALVHKCLPAEALVGLVGYDESTTSMLLGMTETAGVSIKVSAHPSWYP